MNLPKTLLVGCGEKQVKRIRERCAAIDIDKECILKSKRIRPGNLYFEADVEKMPFENEQFEKVICTEVLEHVNNPLKALKEINRVMKKNGKLILTVPFVKSVESLAKKFPLYKRDVVKGFHKQSFDEERIIDLLRKSKFSKVKLDKTRRFGSIIYWLIWAKIIKILNLENKLYIEEVGRLRCIKGNFLNNFILKWSSRFIFVTAVLIDLINPKKNKTTLKVEATK